MRGGDDFKHALLAHGGDGLHVARNNGLERLLALPFRMLIGLSLHLVGGEDELVVHRLLDPERAVIVEGGDAILGLHIIGPTLLRYARDEIDDGLLGWTFIPGRQRIGLSLGQIRPSAEDQA